MNQIVEMRHLMQKRGCQLEDGPVKVLGAEIDFPILLTAGGEYPKVCVNLQTDVR